jgi:hypothetical protein
MSNPTGDALTALPDELTFDFTPAQAQAIRAYVARCEREFLRSLRASDRRWMTEQKPAPRDVTTATHSKPRSRD